MVKSKMAEELLQTPANREKITHDRIAKYIMKLRTFSTLEETEEILVYNRTLGKYEFNGEAVIKKMAEKILDEQGLSAKATNHYMKEVVGYIARATYVPRSKLNSSRHFINLKNGRLNLRTMELLNHTAEFLSTFRIPVEFDLDANCPKIRRFLSQIVAEENVPLLEEIFGWCLDTRSQIQRTILLIGEGANGKSTFLQLLQEFLGSKNCSAISLQDLSKNRFASSQLYGKLANIHPDLPSTKLTDSSFLKTLTGGDTITAEKKFKDSFEFINKAKMIFSANTPPNIADDSKALWRRIIIVDFPNIFMGEEADQQLLKKLTTREELSGLLNIAIEGLKRLREKGDFSYPQTWQKTQEKYAYLADPVTAFVEEDCAYESDKEISKQDLYKAYVSFCKRKGVAAKNDKGFGHSLKQKYQRNIGERRNNWTGIILKNPVLHKRR